MSCYIGAAMREPSVSDPLLAWSRLVTAAIASATDFWGRGLEIGARYATEMVDSAARSGGSLRGVAGARHLAAELSALPGLALERFGAALDPATAEEAQPSLSPPVEGRSVVFPLRVLDASEGIAVYAGPAGAAQTLLDVRHHGELVAADLGRGRTALEIYVVDYRITDLGVYRELGIALFAAPRGRPLQVGLAVIDEPVTGHFACRVGVEILGDPKTEERLDFDDRGAALACTLVRAGSGGRVLTIALPRGGTGVSTDVPFTLYTRPGDRLHVSRLRRSGRGERVRSGGEGVSLTLHDEADPLSRALRSLGLPEAVPILHAWTERLSGQVSRPVPVG